MSKISKCDSKQSFPLNCEVFVSALLSNVMDSESREKKQDLLGAEKGALVYQDATILIALR